MKAPVVTRRPRDAEYTELGGPDEPGEEYYVEVDGVRVGGTHWCGADYVAAGKRWASWGPAGSSPGHHSREDAERVQVDAYLAARRAPNSEQATYTAAIYLEGGGGYLADVWAWTWAEAERVAKARWGAVRILYDDDRMDGFERVDADEVDGLIERHEAELAAAERRRQAQSPRVRALTVRRRREAIQGVRYTADGRRYGTARAGDDDPRFTRAGVPPGAFEPNAAAVFGVLERVSRWTWGDAVQFAEVTKRRAAEMDRWVCLEDARDVTEAARAAGEQRVVEMLALRDLVTHLNHLITPEEAARKPGEYSLESALWDGVFGVVLGTVRAYLVADRPELPRAAYEALTSVWRTAFPDDVTPERD